MWTVPPRRFTEVGLGPEIAEGVDHRTPPTGFPRVVLKSVTCQTLLSGVFWWEGVKSVVDVQDPQRFWWESKPLNTLSEHLE